MNLHFSARLGLLAAGATLLALSLSGCSKRQAYEGMRSSQKLECERAPNRSELDRCLQRQGLGFEEYERRRASDAEAAKRAESEELPSRR